MQEWRDGRSTSVQDFTEWRKVRGLCLSVALNSELAIIFTGFEGGFFALLFFYFSCFPLLLLLQGGYSCADMGLNQTPLCSVTVTTKIRLHAMITVWRYTSCDVIPE